MQVFAVFEHAAHGFDHRLIIEIFPVQSNQSRGPVQCLGNAGALVEIHLADFLHERANLLRHLVFNGGKFGRDDFVFFLETSDTRSSDKDSGA